MIPLLSLLLPFLGITAVAGHMAAIPGLLIRTKKPGVINTKEQAKLHQEQQDAFMRGYRSAVSGEAETKHQWVHDQGCYSLGQSLGRMHLQEAALRASLASLDRITEMERWLAESRGKEAKEKRARKVKRRP